ncbi:unnamed protein product [Dimorphilus gyrociliatus]|uniref:Uncharacterized protein n=1 Tax=Dimorphilus gyrociliatus TaxID=2664684 RepID=A0A7I8VY44_9ANNE|nr:unnamed protein product [Dimorphilus gyrociliatus]CAD5121159.1 unnamed protein product [Dimorphilus gyrociliatus]
MRGLIIILGFLLSCVFGAGAYNDDNTKDVVNLKLGILEEKLNDFKRNLSVIDHYLVDGYKNFDKKDFTFNLVSLKNTSLLPKSPEEALQIARKLISLGKKLEKLCRRKQLFHGKHRKFVDQLCEILKNKLFGIWAIEVEFSDSTKTVVDDIHLPENKYDLFPMMLGDQLNIVRHLLRLFKRNIKVEN